MASPDCSGLRRAGAGLGSPKYSGGESSALRNLPLCCFISFRATASSASAVRIAPTIRELSAFISSELRPSPPVPCGSTQSCERSTNERAGGEMKETAVWIHLPRARRRRRHRRRRHVPNPAQLLRCGRARAHRPCHPARRTGPQPTPLPPIPAVQSGAPDRRTLPTLPACLQPGG